MSTSPRVVVDACVFVDLLTGQDPQRQAHARRLTVAGLRGELTVVVPAPALAEVCGAVEVDGDQLAPDVAGSRRAAAREWLQNSAFVVAAIDDRVGRRAAELAGRFHLPGADACVLACTELWRCSTLYTWGKALLDIGDELPGVLVRDPSSLPLPEELPFDDA